MENHDQPSEYFKKFSLVLEYQHLSNSGLDGLLIYPSHDQPLSAIDGTLLVHSGFWSGAKVHFSLSLPQGGSAPYLRVTTRNLFHPLISPVDGSIATLHATQNASQASRLYPLVFTLHRLFNAPLAQLVGSSDCIKDETAASLFQEDKEGFARQIKQNSQFLENLDNSSPYQVQSAEEWTPELQSILDRVLGREKDDQSAVGVFETSSDLLSV